jgi:endonuclease/exonuclease/phosphatase family metal-dependent hydrolase
MNSHEQEPAKRNISLKTKLAIGVTCLTAALGSYWHFLGQETGRIDSYEPSSPVSTHMDNRLIMGSWNMHDEALSRASDIEAAIEKHKLDVLALQEVSYEDYKGIQSYGGLTNMYMTYVTADARVRPLEGGYGNVLITAQKPENVESDAVGGTSLLAGAVGMVAGLGVDVAQADTSLNDTKEASQENRAILSADVQTLDNQDRIQDTRTVTTHIAGDHFIHYRQFGKVRDSLVKNSASDIPLVFCGDLNEQAYSKVTEYFKPLSLKVPRTGHTSTSNQTIDYCAYSATGFDPDSVEIKVDYRFVTDHRLLVFQGTPIGRP